MKKRVLITTGIFPPDIGGPATFLSYFAEDLQKEEFDVSVLTFGKKPASAKGYGEARAGEYSFPVKKVQSKLAYLLNIFLMAFKADVIYAQDLYTAGYCSYLMKKIFPEKKLVIRFVGDYAWEKAVSAGAAEDDLMTFNQKQYDAKIEKMKKWRLKILEKADVIITVSNFLKNVLLQIGIAESKIKVIYNSVDFLQEQFDEPLDKKRFKIANGLFTISESASCTGMCSSCGGHDINVDGKIILTIARLVKWKGIEALIEIMPDLAAKYGDVKLVVLGDGPEKEKLENLAAEIQVKLLSKNIFLKGRVEHRKTLDYLKVADVFVLNTNYEGLSHTLLEAMNIGVPIVTTPAGGNVETIENEKTGLLVEFNNKEQLKKAIGRLIENPEFAQTIAKNAKKSLDKFNWKNLVEETIKVFLD